MRHCTVDFFLIPSFFSYSTYEYGKVSHADGILYSGGGVAATASIASNLAHLHGIDRTLTHDEKYFTVRPLNISTEGQSPGWWGRSPVP
jgi:hypothetical protein